MEITFEEKPQLNINSFFKSKTWISKATPDQSKLVRIPIINRASPCLYGGSLEIMLSVLVMNRET